MFAISHEERVAECEATLRPLGQRRFSSTTQRGKSSQRHTLLAENHPQFLLKKLKPQVLDQRL